MADHPDALAIDNGAEMLTYEEFADARPTTSPRR